MYNSVRLVFYKEKIKAEGIETALTGGQSVNLAFHDAVVIATFIQISNLVVSIIPKLKSRKNNR
ncbi:MAG: hypothetical protein JW864_14925 [Spirochaetes bacterium]|nr:hypothetical protein [Spirochaetota bacterium]